MCLYLGICIAWRNLGHSLITQTAALEQMIDSSIPMVHALWHTCHNCLFLFPSAFVKLTFIFEAFIFTQHNQFPLTLVYLVLTQQYFFWLQCILQWWRPWLTSIHHTDLHIKVPLSQCEYCRDMQGFGEVQRSVVVAFNLCAVLLHTMYVHFSGLIALIFLCASAHYRLKDVLLDT